MDFNAHITSINGTTHTLDLEDYSSADEAAKQVFGDTSPTRRTSARRCRQGSPPATGSSTRPLTRSDYPGDSRSMQNAQITLEQALTVIATCAWFAVALEIIHFAR